MQTVAKEYGVSDVALGKICKKLLVPLPERGYWAKKVAQRPARLLPMARRNRLSPRSGPPARTGI